jgi:hypothetical protein
VTCKGGLLSGIDRYTLLQLTYKIHTSTKVSDPSGPSERGIKPFREIRLRAPSAGYGGQSPPGTGSYPFVVSDSLLQIFIFTGDYLFVRVSPGRID